MTIQSSRKIFTTSSSLMALTVESALEAAGIPAEVLRSNNGSMEVQVAGQHAHDARQLLFAVQHNGEIFFTPGAACRLAI